MRIMDLVSAHICFHHTGFTSYVIQANPKLLEIQLDSLPVLSQIDWEYSNSEPCFVFFLTLCSALLTVSHLKTLFI